MSSNKIKQDNVEQSCMNRVKNEFSRDICFGVPVEDFESLQGKIGVTKANPKSNDFPDFLFPGGFIEHFQVTSAKESRKGSSHKIKESRFAKENKKIEQSLSPNIPSAANTMEYENHSYSSLRSSFEKNWNKHLESLEKYNGEKNTGIFMVEYLDTLALSMAESSLEGVAGLICGDINPKQEKFGNYRLSRDKSMQKFLRSLSDEIYYVIFVTATHVEIIDLKNIDRLHTIMPYEYFISDNTTFVTKSWTPLKFVNEMTKTYIKDLNELYSKDLFTMSEADTVRISNCLRKGLPIYYDDNLIVYTDDGAMIASLY